MSAPPSEPAIWLPALFAGAPHGVLVVDTGRRITAANPTAEAMLGYGRGELLGLSTEELVPPEEAARVGGLGRGLLRGERERFVVEVRFRRKDAGLFLGRIVVWLARDDRGEPACAVCVLEDAEAGKRAEEERGRLLALARTAGQLGHDLNNLITPVLGFAELLLLELPPGSAGAGWANEIRLAAERTRERLGQILAMRREIAALTGGEARPAAGPPAPAPGDRLGHGTVLVMEPDAELRELARAILELHGHRVLLAAGPDEAIRLAAEAPVDLLLADLDALAAGAVELHARLARERPGLPALYLCAQPDAVRDPPGRLLAKPFTVQSLLLTVLEAMGSITPAPAGE